MKKNGYVIHNTNIYTIEGRDYRPRRLSTREQLSASPIVQVFLIIIIAMFFFTCIRYFYSGVDRPVLFTDLISFFANFSSLRLSIPQISSIHTGLVLVDTVLNSMIVGVNCLTFIFSSLINLVVFAFRFIIFIFS